ncbi:MAG: plasmid pRiA4b ORF-3 family protein [Spirochaetaceae bacterium]|nr:MAG: plasmid pRiA4b ORF-3 family protein [Spirochaetaceae bacterium]
MRNLIEEVEAHIGSDSQKQSDNNSPDAEPESIFVLKVTLQDIRPPIWRRVRVPGNYTLYELHMIIQDVMEWEDYHLHAFRINGVNFMDPEQVDDLDGAEDETVVTLDALMLRQKQKLSYTYDFGDNWRHTIMVEQIVPAVDADEDERYSVRCLAGRRACPPEDCGGPWGYADLLELLQRPEAELDSDEAERLEWLGESFDPEAFDLQEINDTLDEY